MAELDETAVLARAKEIAAQDGFTWEFDFSAPNQQRGPLRRQHFLSRDQQEEYLERARAELREDALV